MLTENTRRPNILEGNTPFCYVWAVKRKTIIYLEDDVLKTMRVAAARSGKHDYQVVEEALRAHLGIELLETVGARSELDEAASVTRIARAVFDSGVLIAGLISANGAPRALLRRWLQGSFELVVSPALLTELERVLLRPKFRSYATESEAHAYVSLVRRLATIVDDPPLVTGLTPDPGDDYLVVLARASGVQTLVSGDRHLYELEAARPPVLQPRAFLEELDS